MSFTTVNLLVVIKYLVADVVEMSVEVSWSECLVNV